VFYVVFIEKVDRDDFKNTELLLAGKTQMVPQQQTV